jgi:hypothetical protein
MAVGGSVSGEGVETRERGERETSQRRGSSQDVATCVFLKHGERVGARLDWLSPRSFSQQASPETF